MYFIIQDTVLVTLAPPPDFVVNRVEVETDIVAGDTISITYEVLNDGYGAPFETWPWQDIIVSTISVLHILHMGMQSAYTALG